MKNVFHNPSLSLLFLGFYLDAQASLEFLLNRQDIDHEKIVLYGRSLGGAVAIDLATNENYAEHIFALIVENTFTSIPDIACHMFFWIKRLPTVCYRNQVCLTFKTFLILVTKIVWVMRYPFMQVRFCHTSQGLCSSFITKKTSLSAISFCKFSNFLSFFLLECGCALAKYFMFARERG